MSKIMKMQYPSVCMNSAKGSNDVQGRIKLLEKWCFGAHCRRSEKHHRDSSQQKLSKDDSTQTCERWIAKTCITRKKLLQQRDKKRLLNLSINPDDNYDRLTDFKSRSMKSTTTKTCKHDYGCGFCELMRDRVFAEIALQTDVTRYEIIKCASTKDQSVSVDELSNNKNTDNKPVTLQKKRSSPVAVASTSANGSSNKTVVKKSKKSLSSLKKKSSVALGKKKANKLTVKKSIASKSSKKINNTATATGNSRVKKPTKVKKKKRAMTTNKKVMSTMLAAATKKDASTQVETVEEEVNEELEVLKVVIELKDDRDDRVLVERREPSVKTYEKDVRKFSAEKSTSIPNEAFEQVKGIPNLTDKVFIDKRNKNNKVVQQYEANEGNKADVDVDVDPVMRNNKTAISTCSSKCQGVVTSSGLLQLPHHAATISSISTSSKKQFENDSTTPEKVDFREKLQNRKKIKSKLKIAIKSRSNSSSDRLLRRDDDHDSYYFFRKKKAKKSDANDTRTTTRKTIPTPTIVVPKIESKSSTKIVERETEEVNTNESEKSDTVITSGIGGSSYTDAELSMEESSTPAEKKSSAVLSIDDMKGRNSSRLLKCENLTMKLKKLLSRFV